MERFRPQHVQRFARAPLVATSRSAAPLQLLRIGDLCRLLCISKPTFWRMRRDAGFPPPTRISRRVVGWRVPEVESWLALRRGEPHSRGRDSDDYR